MKTTSTSSSRGFTLVELLVVIAIIVILAAAGFAAGTFAMNKARKVQAEAAAVAIEQAVSAFINEYNSLPVEATSGTTDMQIKTDDVRFLKALLGTEDPNNSDIRNPRGIRFLNVKTGKGRKGGLIYDSNQNITGLFDPWGNLYTVELDANYDEELEFQTPDSRTQRLNGKRVAIHSPGVKRGERVKPSDLIKTW